jgi:hypothetical protein
VLQRTVGGLALRQIGDIQSSTKENPMNTFSSSSTMTLNLARHTHAVPAAQTHARDALRALKAEQHAAGSVTRNPWAALVRRFAVTARVPSPAPRPLTAR